MELLLVELALAKARIFCELVNGNIIIGTVQKVAEGAVHISDSGHANANYVAIQHIVQFRVA